MTESLASPFAPAAPFYDAFRPPYAPAALAWVAKTFGLGPGVRVLDLGCGPGALAIPLSRTGAAVVALDPDAAMLAEGRRCASERGAGEIEWVCGRAEDVLGALGRFRLAIMGQSFHWMDRDLVLARLHDALEPGGGLALVDEGRRRPQESWEPVAGRVVEAFLGRRGRHPGKHPESAHAPSLRRSAGFREFTVREFPTRTTRDVASIVGAVYSGVGSAKPLFGDRVGAFEAALAAALLALNHSGVFEERLETAVVIAPLA